MYLSMQELRHYVTKTYIIILNLLYTRSKYLVLKELGHHSYLMEDLLKQKILIVNSYTDEKKLTRYNVDNFQGILYQTDKVSKSMHEANINTFPINVSDTQLK